MLNLSDQFGQKDHFFQIQPLDYEISNNKNSGIMKY